MDNETLKRLTLKFSRDFDAVLLATANQITANQREFQAAGSNEILKQELSKHHYLITFAGLKEAADVLHSFEILAGVDLPAQRLFIGEYLARQLGEMELKGIFLAMDEYSALFNISQEQWQDHFSKKPPQNSFEVLFNRRLSQEPLAKHMVQYLLGQAMGNPLLLGNMLGENF